MNRNTRTLIVLLVAVVTAGLATLGVYVAIRQIPVRQVEVAHTFVVAAAHPMRPGARVTAKDVKLVAWPERAMMPGVFSKIEPVVNRGVIVSVMENEPLTESKLAPIAAGAGLPPTITPGMRAISVRVNEVVGVAGFVTPGTRVDVLVTLKHLEAKDSTVTRVVVNNVQVLTAGTRYDQDKAKNGDPIPSSVVTLLLTPEDAERVVLAANEGQLMLALRNPLDVEPTSTGGTRTATLFSASAPPRSATPERPAPRVRPVGERPVARPVEPPVAPTAPTPYTIEAIRGAKRSAETVRRGEDSTP
jgi:pilus assembly protein CpaB